MYSLIQSAFKRTWEMIIMKNVHLYQNFLAILIKLCEVPSYVIDATLCYL